METPLKIRSLKYDSGPQQPIFFTTTSAKETSQLHNFRLSPPGFTQNLGGGGGDIMMIPLTDVSFSTYLKPPPELDHHQQLKSSAAAPPVLLDDSEISIFDAQKYFNESNPNPKTRSSSSFSPPQIISIHDHTNPDDHTNILPRLSSVDGYNRARSFHATPTASSEASWNSQTGLLSNPPGALAVSLRNLPSKSDYHRDGKRGVSNSTNADGTNGFLDENVPAPVRNSFKLRN